MINMELNKVYTGDSFELIKQVDDDSIDLIVTSPPYADTKSYGKKINVLHPDKYVGWITPLFVEMNRTLKPTGSIIWNIDDKCHKKLRHTFVFDLIHHLTHHTDVKLYDYYIWSKKSFLPNGGQKRLNHVTEWILHFVKDQNQVKFNMDEVREPYAKSTIKRCKKGIADYSVNEDGIKNSNPGIRNLNKKGKTPSNLFWFNTNATTKGNKHPAPFNKEIPLWFIKALTDENDVVLDPFMGSGTTAKAAIELNRQWLGFELNEEYIKMIEERIKIKQLSL